MHNMNHTVWREDTLELRLTFPNVGLSTWKCISLLSSNTRRVNPHFIWYYKRRMSCNNSTNIFLISLISSMKTDIRTNNIDQQDIITFAYVFSVTLMVVFGLLSNLLSIDTFRQVQLKSTTVGFYLLVYSYCSFCPIFMLQVRLIQLVDSLNYVEFFCICNIITPISSIIDYRYSLEYVGGWIN